MEKTYKAEQKFLLMSPRKLRPVVEAIKKMKPVEAVVRLPFVQRRAGAEIAKVIKAAIANARVQGVSETDLVFSEIRIGEGPRLKRGIAVSRGQWHPIKKRMAHIRVILTTIKKEEIKDNKKKNIETKTAKAEVLEAVKSEKKIVKAKVVKEKKGQPKNESES